MSTDPRASDVVGSVHGLAVEYGSGERRTRALAGVDLAIRRGERIAIVGESGSGKSTLALALAQLLPRSARVEGRIRLAGRDAGWGNEAASRLLRGAAVGSVFQDSKGALHPLIRIEEQVAEAWTAHGRETRARALELARAALGRVGLDPVRHGRAFPHELSGGMRQRVQIATALALFPALLVLDEPTTALDTVTQKLLFDQLEELRRERPFATLLVTHDLALSCERADRVVRLAHGRIVDERPAREVVRERPPVLRTAEAHPARAAVLAAEGLSIEYSRRRAPLIRARGARVVEGAALELRRGEVLALVGNSGSGKTSLVRGILRLVEPVAGHVSYRRNGAAPIDLLGLEPRALRAARPDLAVVFQDPALSLDPRQRVHEVLSEALAARNAGALDAGARGRELLAEVGLGAEHLERLPHQLSGGEAQRVCLARALATEPRVLVLDEALASLDAANRARVLTLLARRRDAGLSILLVTHDLGSVECLADRVAVVASGRIVECGPTERIFAAPEHAETRALLAARPGT